MKRGPVMAFTGVGSLMSLWAGIVEQSTWIRDLRRHQGARPRHGPCARYRFGCARRETSLARRPCAWGTAWFPADPAISNPAKVCEREASLLVAGVAQVVVGF
jgi:hypothetical protein